ncbi:unnamed protein product [Rotaria sp. Silwood2]|nr:unnamed protein product [Rotaria sp. Silwood2]
MGTKTIPIGRLLPGYRCVILDDFSQPVFIGQEGELFVGGVGVFAGYLGRNELTKKALVDIDGEHFYRTGDLVRFDSHGLLYYVGRKDHQVKLHGQRIELGEIERCLLQASSNVSRCVVVKYDDDHLVAYIQSNNINEKQLRQYCQSHLPSFMIPSMFIVLEQLPLNANGKLDRKRLPTPNFTALLSCSVSTNNQNHYIQPSNEIETSIHKLWCEIFQCKQISTTDSIFTIGGHSLILIQIYHRYKSIFKFHIHNLNIAQIFQYPTIQDHARFIEQSLDIEQWHEKSWLPLNISQGQVSFAQERIFLDEQIRFASNGNQMYNIPLVYRISSSGKSLSILRLQRALQAIVMKHSILRTALLLHTNGIVMQSVTEIDSLDINYQESFGFTILDTNDVESAIYETIRRSDLFDLTKGRVLHCYIIRDCSSSLENEDLLMKNDIILFNIHHSAFDGASTSIFLRDLSLAYNLDAQLPFDINMLQYIDYSVHERQLDMMKSRDFWNAQLDGYDMESRLLLPVDRHRLSNNQRSGRASVAEISFDQHLSHSFLTYASSHNVTPFQLGLAVFYTFLFKVSNGQQDLCIAGVNANRYRIELQDMIGMFVATLPYRIQLDPTSSFEKLVEQVRDLCLSILDHSHYPLQQIIGSHHSPAFLETMFDFITIDSDIEHVELDGAMLEPVSLEKGDFVAKFDLMLMFVHKLSGGITFSLTCSQDLFDETTVQLLAERFSYLLDQLFEPNQTLAKQPSLHQLSIILPQEHALIHTLKTNDINRSSAIFNTVPQSFSQVAFSHLQKVSVELDEQALTYGELLFYVQQFALLLINVHGVKEGDVVCQCVERSLSMVIGIMSIQMAGASYCPLSPRDPLQRLYSLIEETHSHIILVHQLTQNKFQFNIPMIDIDTAINTEKMLNDIDLSRLTNVAMDRDSIAYVLFTSGSTGTPKAAQIRHQNFIEAIRSISEVGILSEEDTVVQMTPCSFDGHLEDIVGTLIVGGTLVMLCPHGHMDFEYLSNVLMVHHITYMDSVPTLLAAFFSYVKGNSNIDLLRTLQTVCSGGRFFDIP